MKDTSQRLVFFGLALGTVVLFGSSFAVTKYALGWAGPVALAFLRWAVSGLALVIWLAARRELGLAVTALRRDGVNVAWLAAVGISLYYICQNTAVRFTTATNAAILTNLLSVFMVIFAMFWGRERLRPAGWAAMGAAFLGAGLVSAGSGHLSVGGTGLVGDLLMVLACIAGALYSLGVRAPGKRHRADVLLAVVAVPGALFMLPFALWEGLTLMLPPEFWLAVVALGIGSGIGANLCWIELMGRTTAARAGAVLYIVPVFAAVLAAVMLGETVTPAMAAGGALVLGGVAVMERAET